MFKLIKLAAYALLGYALYEFCRGMFDDRSDSNQGTLRNQSSRGQAGGTTATTHEPSGASAKHPGGRGVVSR